MNENYQINSLFCYTETAKGLEFSFESDIKRNDYRFENCKFNKNYKWIIGSVAIFGETLKIRFFGNALHNN